MISLLAIAARDQLALDHRRALARKLLVVLGLAARVGVAGDLELEVGDARHLEVLLGVDQRVGQLLHLGVAARAPARRCRS